MNETTLAGCLALLAGGFLGGFWFLPGGVLALRRRARGEMQVDLRPGFRPETLYRLFDLYGPEGIRAFRRMLRVDMVFPAVYGALFFVLGDIWAATSSSAFQPAGVIRVAGVAAAVFDYGENTFLLLAIRHLPRQQFAIARLASLCTSLKTAGILTALGAVAVHFLSR